jgi:NAD(P)H-hydrate epimerase
MIEVDEVARIERLEREAHKGDRGRVLLIAGSIRMSGAARLAGWGALRGGAGLLTIATPSEAQPIVAADLACAMTLPLPSRRGVFTATGAAEALAFAEGVDAVGFGPGITTDVAPFFKRLLPKLMRPYVLDADGLNLLAKSPELIGDSAPKRVLTPHPGEAERLLGRPIESDPDARIAAAGELAERFRAVAVLKGADTVVCDGDRYYVNRTGNPGMATGGTGDVLTGLVAARLGAGAGPFTAATQAVFLHGRAGDLAAAAVGERSMIAEDLVANLAGAMAELTEQPAQRTTRPRAAKRGKGTGSRRRGGANRG